MEPKKIIIPLVVAVVIIAAIVVAMTSSDGGKDTPVETESVTVTAYEMSYLIYDQKDPRSQDPARDIADYCIGDLDFLIKKGQGEVLYSTLDTFVKLLEADMYEGYAVTAGKEGKACWLEFSDTEGRILCKLTFDASDMSITEQGRPQGVRSNTPPETTYEELQADFSDIVNPGHPFRFSFAGYGLDAIEKNGEIYFPIDLVSLEFQRVFLMRAYVYSSDENILFQYRASGQMDVEFIKGSDSHATISKVISSSYSKYENDKGVINPPAYMLEHVRNLFYYMMDNCYGLNSVTGCKSMSEFFKNNSYNEKLVSPDPTERATAYKIIIALLQDSHTGYTASSLLGEDDSISAADYIQYLRNDREALRSILSAEREAVLREEGVEKITDVRYSTDGRTAYFSFDKFESAIYYHEELTPEERLADTYYMFVKNLNEIKDHGGVEKVIIDDSVNGGGNTYLMCKVLALMSKDNLMRMDFAYDNSGTVTEVKIRVDSNGDGVFDEKDCFGQYFDFYILTSSFSFSCGNGLPFLAKSNDIATIIGTKSGGGESGVETNLFPFGVQIRHSALMHLGFYDHDTQAWKGDEAGQPVDIEIFTDWYDVDAISEVIDSHNTSI